MCLSTQLLNLYLPADLFDDVAVKITAKLLANHFIGAQYFAWPSPPLPVHSLPPIKMRARRHDYVNEPVRLEAILKQQPPLKPTVRFRKHQPDPIVCYYYSSSSRPSDFSANLDQIKATGALITASGDGGVGSGGGSAQQVSAVASPPMSTREGHK